MVRKKLEKKPKKPKKPLGVPQIVFQVLNTALICVILGFLAYRAITYKQIFDGEYANSAAEKTVMLYDALTGAGITDVDNFLSNDDGSYTYINNPKYNYIYYSGRLFRAMNINENGDVRMVDMEIEGLSNLVAQENYAGSTLDKWLNTYADDEHSGVYVKSLTDYSELLVGTDVCADKVNKTEDTGCSYFRSGREVALLTFNDYVTMGGNESYVNTQDAYWLQTNTEDGVFWFIQETGAVSLGDHDTQYIGIRPVITISGTTIVNNGTGTKEDPFNLDTVEKSAAKNLTVSNYVSYSGKLWRVTEKDTEGNAVMILNGYVSNAEDKPVTIAFGSNPVYNTSSGVGQYLNSTFLNTLENYQEVLTAHDWYYGPLLEDDGYDYHGGYASTMNAYVGLPNTGCLFLNDFPNIFLMNTVNGSKEFTYVLDEYNHLYQQLLTSNGIYMRPLIAVKADTAISGGKGTQEEPYILVTGGEQSEQ